MCRCGKNYAILKTNHKALSARSPYQAWLRDQIVYAP